MTPPPNRTQRRAAARSNGKAKPAEGEQVEQLHGVIVRKQVAEDGGLSISVETAGTVQVTEVQTLLEMALKQVRQMLGLAEQK